MPLLFFLPMIIASSYFMPQLPRADESNEDRS